MKNLRKIVLLMVLVMVLALTFAACDEPIVPFYPPVRNTPSEPKNFSATAGDGEVLLDWTAADDGESIIKYEVSFKKSSAATDGDWVTADTATSHTVEELENGTEYTFKVRAVSEVAAGFAATTTATPIAGISEPRTLTDADKEMLSNAIEEFKTATNWRYLIPSAVREKYTLIIARTGTGEDFVSMFICSDYESYIVKASDGKWYDIRLSTGSQIWRGRRLEDQAEAEKFFYNEYVEGLDNWINFEEIIEPTKEVCTKIKADGKTVYTFNIEGMVTNTAFIDEEYISEAEYEFVVIDEKIVTIEILIKMYAKETNEYVGSFNITMDRDITEIKLPENWEDNFNPGIR